MDRHAGMTDAPCTGNGSREVPAGGRDQAGVLSVCRSISTESGLFALAAGLAMKFVLVVN